VRRALQLEPEQLVLQVLGGLDQADLALVGAQVAGPIAHDLLAAAQCSGGLVEAALRPLAAPESQPGRPQDVAVVDTPGQLDRTSVFRHRVVAATLLHPQVAQAGARGGLAADVAGLRVQRERPVVELQGLLRIVPVAVDARQQGQCAPLFERVPLTLQTRQRVQQRALGFVEPALAPQRLAAIGEHEGLQARQALELGPLQRQAVCVEGRTVLELAQVAVAHADQQAHREALVAFGGGQVAVRRLVVEVARCHSSRAGRPLDTAPSRELTSSSLRAGSRASASTPDSNANTASCVRLRSSWSWPSRSSRAATSAGRSSVPARCRALPCASAAASGRPAASAFSAATSNPTTER
jgi:hypothetical protein